MSWSWLDVSTYVINNSLPGLVVGVFMGLVIGGFIGSMCFGVLGKGKEERACIIGLFFGLAVWLLCIIINLTPTHDSLLRLKISKIKNETLTEVNLIKGIDEVKRIAGKLECKYLGGCKKKSK